MPLSDYQFLHSFCLDLNKTVGSRFAKFMPVAGSTMEEMERLARLGSAPHGFVVAALVQTNGVGSRDADGQSRAWHSLCGNAMLSVAVHAFPGAVAAEPDMIAALAVRDIVAAHVGSARVRNKYPNDILVTLEDGVEAKISGVLTRPTSAPGIFNVGVGFNVAHAPESSALRGKSVVRRATALHLCAPPTRGVVDVGTFIGYFMDAFLPRVAAWKTSRDIRPVLERMGFIDEDGGTNVTLPDNHVVKGRFDRFLPKNRVRLEVGRNRWMSLPMRDAQLAALR